MSRRNNGYENKNKHEINGIVIFLCSKSNVIFTIYNIKIKNQFCSFRCYKIISPKINIHIVINYINLQIMLC